LKSSPFRCRAVVLMAVIFVAGCANPAVRQFDEGRQLLSEGKIEPGLEEIDLAAKADPTNPEYRTYFFKQREAAVNQMLAQADSARDHGQLDEAESIYRRVLGLDVSNPRATVGIEELQSDRRRMTELAEAEALFKHGDTDGAEAKLRPILAENPTQPAANALKQRIENASGASTIVASSLKLALKKPITLEFQDAPIKAVFEVISRVAGLNFVFDKDVRPDLKATIFVKNTTVEDAVKLLLVTNQLGKQVLSENTILIYPNTAAKNGEYQQLVVKGFYLANADVKKTVEMIKTILKTKDVFVDEKMNLVVMRDTPEVIRMAEKLIADQDLPDPEVMLEVEVLETSKDFASNIGLQYPQQISASLGNAGTYTLNQWKNRDANFVTYQVTNPALVLNLQRTDSNTTLLANPRIRVKDKEKAKIQIGERLPVITTVATAGVGSSQTVNYIDVGLKLDVQPNIRLDDQVDMKVELEVSSVLNTVTLSSGDQVYQLGTRDAATALRLKDGETQILAGLIQHNENSAANKVPGLADLPLLGRLFSSDNSDKSKTELVLLITPHIVRNVERPDAVYSEFPTGSQTDIGGPVLANAPPPGPVQAEPVPSGIEKPSDQDAKPATVMPDGKRSGSEGAGAAP
jgi:general secretion pathway protein D